MKISKDSKFSYLELRHGDFSSTLPNFLITNADIVEDTTFYGLSLIASLPHFVNDDFVSTFTDFFGQKPTSYELQLFKQLTIIGDGQCTECGGEMELFDGEFKVSQFDYDSEPEENPVWTSYKCKVCGFITSNEPDI